MKKGAGKTVGLLLLGVLGLLMIPLLVIGLVLGPAIQGCFGTVAQTGSNNGTAIQVADNKDYQAPEHSDNPVSEKIAAFAEKIALDDSHGYSQARRNSLVDFDCSSLVWFGVKDAGIDLGNGWPFTTNTMGPILEAHGFTHIAWSGQPQDAQAQLQRGDIIMNLTQHTEIYVGGGLFAGARHASPSGVEDGMPGDRTQGIRQEIGIGPYIDPTMPNAYRYTGDTAQATGGNVDVGVTVSAAAATMGSCDTSASSAPNSTVDASYTGDGSKASPEQARAIAKELLPQYFPGTDEEKEFSCLVELWNHESGWRWNADNPSSDAYGIPQSLPGSKMASAGADWETNAGTQIKWGLQYIKNRADYGSPCKAWDMWQSRSPHWY